MAIERKKATKKVATNKAKANKKPRKKRVKKDLDISIDTKNVDVDINRKDGVTTIELDTDKFDMTIEKSNDEVKVDVRTDSRLGNIIGKIVTRIIKRKRG